MSASQSAQAKVGRIVGLSLAGLWLAVSMLAAFAGSLEAPAPMVAAVESDPAGKIVAVSN